MSATALQAAANGVTRPRGDQSRRRFGGFALSISIHAAFVLLALGTMRGELTTGGGGSPDGDLRAIDISLAGLKGASPPAPANPSSDPLAAMFRRLQSAPSAIPTSEEREQPTTDLKSLVEIIDKARAARAALRRGEGQSSTDLNGKGAATSALAAVTPERRAIDGSKRDGQGAAASSGDLWGQIKPCWDDLSEVAAVPVTLRILLDDKGRIAKPPVIIRPPGGPPDERRLISESHALAALAACVPYNAKRWWDPKQEFEVRFARGQ